MWRWHVRDRLQKMKRVLHEPRAVVHQLEKQKQKRKWCKLKHLRRLLASVIVLVVVQTLWIGVEQFYTYISTVYDKK